MVDKINGNTVIMSRDELKKGVSILGGRAKLKVSQDLLEACILMDGEPGIELMRDLKEVFEQYGICHGVLGLPRSEGDRWVVAQGVPPENGVDGTILVYPFPEDEGKELEGIRRDERARSCVVNVEKGQIVAKKTPPTEGSPGVNIFGEEIPPVPGKWPVFKIGEGVEVEANQRHLMALWTGKLDVANDGTISVLKEWNITGDVDLSVGNIEFWGERLMVSGSINEGMEVRVRGDLEVGKNIQDEVSVEVGGNLVVRGVIRSKMTRVSVAKDLRCNAIESAHVNVRGDLEIGDYALDARLEIGGHLFAVSGKGLMTGGSIRVGRSVAVRVAGSLTSTRTKIVAGFDPVLQREYKVAVDALEEISQGISRVREGLYKIERLQKQRGGLGEKGRKLREDLLEAFRRLKEEYSDRRRALEAMEKRLGQLQQSQVQVFEKIFPNVQINIYNAVYEVRHEMQSVVFRFEKGKVVIYSINKDAGGD